MLYINERLINNRSFIVMATVAEQKVAKTSTDGRAYKLRGGFQLITDDADAIVGIETEMTLIGWHVQPGDCFMLCKVLGMKPADAVARLRQCQGNFDALEEPGDTLEWRMAYRQVAMALPNHGIRPMMLHMTRPITPAGVEDGLEITVFDLSTEAPQPHSIEVNDKLCLSLMRSKATLGSIELLNEFCGSPIFRVVGVPVHVRQYREKFLAERGVEVKVETKDQKSQKLQKAAKATPLAKADLANLDGNDIAAAMSRIAEPSFNYFQRKRTQPRTPEQSAPKFRQKDKDKLPEVAKLSRPQKDLIILRLTDIGVQIPDEVKNIPLRKGRHTALECEGVVEFSHAQLESVNKALRGTHHELVFVSEHSVYALRNTNTNIQFAFTQRDWEFVQRGKMDRRYSGR